jgi:NAD/NADP transhydrogenase alpha subunit
MAARRARTEDSNRGYVTAGAVLSPTAKDVFAEAGMIVKAKEPLPLEYPLLREDQVLFIAGMRGQDLEFRPHERHVSICGKTG